MNCRYGFMRATRRFLDRSTALMFAKRECSDCPAPDAVDSVRETSDQLAFPALGTRIPPGFSHDGSLGGGGGGAPRPMEGCGDGGGRNPPTKGSAIGPTSSTGWNVPSCLLKGAVQRASSFARRDGVVNLGLESRDRRDLPFVLDGAHATPDYP